MKRAKKLLSLLLAGIMTLSLVPTAAFAVEEEPDWTPAVELQVVTSPFIPKVPSQSWGLSFTSDNWGMYLDPETLSYGAIDPYGSLTIPAEDGFSLQCGLGPNLIVDMRSYDRHFALYNSAGTQLTDYVYCTLDKAGDYIVGQRKNGTRDIFTLDGKLFKQPKLPAGYQILTILDGGVMVAGLIKETPNYTTLSDGTRDISYYIIDSCSLWLFSMDGKQLSPSDLPGGGATRINDNLIQLGDNIFDNQGKLVIPNCGSIFSIAPDGSFSCFDNGTTRVFNPKGEEFFQFKGSSITIFSEHTLMYMPYGSPLTFWTDKEGVVATDLNVILDNVRPRPGRPECIPVNLYDGTVSVYDYDGNQILAPTTGYVYANDRCFYLDPDPLTGGSVTFYDTTGKELFTADNASYGHCMNGFPVTYRGDNITVYNMDGEKLSKYNYTGCADSGVDGLINVHRNHKWYLMDAWGNELNTVGFDEPVCFEPGCQITSYCVDGYYGVLRHVDADHPCHFIDVPMGKWFTEPVEFCYATGLMSGTAVAKFDPTTATTRAMLVQILYSLAGEGEICPSHGFKDVPNGKWFTNAVNWAAEYGIVSGTGADTFSPNTPITREQAALILMRFTQQMGIETQSYPAPTKFADWNRVSNWAQDAMCWATGIGLLQGSGGNVNPRNKATRAEIATILRWYVLWLVDQVGVDQLDLPDTLA